MVLPPERYEFAGDWPLREDLLARFFEEEGCAPGIGHSSRLRWQHRQDIFVPRSDLIAQDEQFLHRFSCQERHPGLCCTRHEHCYDRALEVGICLERYFDAQRKHKFFLLWDDADRRRTATCMYFAHIRARRPHAQITHVFASATAKLQATKASGLSVLAFNPPYARHGEKRKFVFLTVWNLALRFLEGGCQRLLVKHLPHKFSADMTARTQVTEADITEGAHEIFPARYRRPPQEKHEVTEAERLLNQLDGKAAKKKKAPKSGGIKGYVGKPSSGRPLPASAPAPGLARAPSATAGPIAGSAAGSSGSAAASSGDGRAIAEFVVDLGGDDGDSQGIDSEPEEAREDRRFKKEANGNIFIRQADGSLPARRSGRLTGPFGPKGCLPHQLNFSMVCSAQGHKNCRLIKTNSRLRFDELRLIEWLLEGQRCTSTAGHKALWKA